MTGPEHEGPEVPEDPALSEAVEDAMKPATREAVMAVWQRVVLGRLDHPDTRDRPRDGEDPDDPPA